MQKLKKVFQIIFFTFLGILGLFIGCIILLVIFLWIKGVVIKPGFEYWPYGGGEFYFKGSVEDFIELYENPYQDEKVYLEFEYLGKQEGDFYAEWDILTPEETIYKVDNNAHIIMAVGRKLERVYYFLPISEHKYLTSKEKELEEYREENNIRKVRVVLSQIKEDQDTLYYYRVEFPEDEEYSYEKNMANKSVAAEYDVLIEGKEIPAIYLNSMQNYGSVWVERYYEDQEHSHVTGVETPIIYIRQY